MREQLNSHILRDTHTHKTLMKACVDNRLLLAHILACGEMFCALSIFPHLEDELSYFTDSGETKQCCVLR